MSKKIAFLIEKFEDKNFRGGGEKLNYNLITHLVELGYEVDVFCNSTNVIQDYGIKNIFVFNLDKNKFFDEAYKKIDRDAYEALFSENLLAPCDICYVHGHTVKYRQNVVRLPYERFLTKLFVPKRFWQSCKKSRTQTAVAQACNKILVPSNLLKDDIVKNLKVDEGNIFVLPPALDLPQKPDEVSNGIFTFGLSAIGFANKGGYLALRAFSKLSKDKKIRLKVIYPKWKHNFFLKAFLQFCGLASKVEFVDKYENIADFYKSIDCLLVPSKEETFGMVITEAMSYQIPVIVSIRCGAKDLIAQGQNGFVFDFDGSPVVNLSQKMEEVIALSQEKRATIGVEARRAVEPLTWSNFIQDFIKILN